MASFPGYAHIAVTVTDLDKSRIWYQELFGVEPMLDEDTGAYYHVAFPIGEGTLFGLHAHPATDRRYGFKEKAVGLDHVAFECQDRAELDSWATRLDELGITHSPVVDAPYGSGLSFRDPDNIALEFFAPPS
jgi:catechol 2,3-dioxygenase-like lactoylglutathione lyase family enzyme